MILMRRLVFIVFFIFIPNPLKAAGIEDAFQNTAALTNVTAAGNINFTAFFYLETKDEYQLLSCNHGLHDYKSLHINLYYKGYKSTDVSAELIRTDAKLDISLLKVGKKEVDKYGKPKIIPIAEGDYRPNGKEVAVTAGFPATCDDEGNRCIIWCSCIVGICWYDPIGDYIYVCPGFIAGRSGSSVLNKECTKIIGILLFQDGSCGTTGRIHKFLENKCE